MKIPLVVSYILSVVGIAFSFAGGILVPLAVYNSQATFKIVEQSLILGRVEVILLLVSLSLFGLVCLMAGSIIRGFRDCIIDLERQIDYMTPEENLTS